MTEEQRQEPMGWLGAPPDIPDGEIACTVETDVVVVGAGVAGVAAAREAAEQGADVVLFEKCKGAQGRFGDFATMNGKTAARWGRDNIDVLAVVADLMKDSCYRADQRILKVWADRAGEDFDWLIAGYPNLTVLETTAEPVPGDCRCWVQPRRLPGPEAFDNGSEYFRCYQTTAWIRPSVVPVLRENLRRAEESGRLRSYFCTPVQRLLREERGRVSGVIARDAQGRYIKAAARRGVVLATGDYSNNRPMLHHYCPWTDGIGTFWIGNDPKGVPSNTGDGHRMAMWAGAKMEDGPHAPMIHHMGGPMGVNAYLQLNRDGHRFVNEDCPGQQIENQIERQPGRVTWQLFDGAWKAQAPFMAPGHGSVCYPLEEAELRSGRINPSLSAWDGYTTQEAVDKAVDGKTVFRADTIEALLRQIGLPLESAKASVERYNELARSGRDEDFGKTPSRLFPLERPPYYAVKFEAAGLLVCMGGLESDHEARCYDTRGEVIPGLFVAGNVQGNRFAVEYPTTVPGLSHSLALIYGRIAGRGAAAGPHPAERR